jgi:hypothetical protein
VAIGAGSRLGPYEVTAFLGEGGRGKVWWAHHTGLTKLTRPDDRCRRGFMKSCFLTYETNPSKVMP